MAKCDLSGMHLRKVTFSIRRGAYEDCYNKPRGELSIGRAHIKIVITNSWLNLVSKGHILRLL